MRTQFTYNNNNIRLCCRNKSYTWRYCMEFYNRQWQVMLIKLISCIALNHLMTICRVYIWVWFSFSKYLLDEW